MFQLIVAVISIALVAALAIASIFYGGEAFTKSSEKAQVTTLINQGQQIAGAVALYQTDNGFRPAAVANLTPTYLASAPAGTKLTIDNTDPDAPVPYAWELRDDSVRIQLNLVGDIVFDPDAPTNLGAFCKEVASQGGGECVEDTDIPYFSFPL